VDLLPDVLLFVDPATLRLVDGNRAACERLGYSREELLTLRLPQIAPAFATAAGVSQLETASRNPESNPLATVHRSRDGQEVPVQWMVFEDTSAEDRGWIIFARATAASSCPASPATKPPLDPLTRLPDRQAFEDRLASSLRRAQRSTTYQFALLFIDLDRFKLVNDTSGHLQGDRLLRDVARRLAGSVRPGDMVSRRGGDEFTVLVDDLRDQRDAIAVAERIQSHLALPLSLDGCPITITASIGIAIGSSAYATPEALLHDADRAMYRAKAAGAGRYAVFDRL
jgi:diguanylate cyclase (GGDEF)-like protein/PAS domain S-box-containing protein